MAIGAPILSYSGLLIVDDSELKPAAFAGINPETTALAIQEQFAPLLDLRASRESSLMMSTTSSGPTPSGDWDPSDTNQAPVVEFIPRVYTTNDLWLEMVSKTNLSGNFVIHLPFDEVGTGVYDLFTTTNLGTSGTGLNGTNWLWLVRTTPGQTNLSYSPITDEMALYRLGRTNDADGDGISDAMEALWSHSDPNASDQNSNGIPDGWEWFNFGDFEQTAEGDFDQDGMSNLAEYQRGFDPNSIRFKLKFPTFRIAGNSVTGSVETLNGVPAQIAILVDSTNYTDAVWSPLGSNFVAQLGSTDGKHDVRVGLKGKAATSVAKWNWQGITRDTIPPLVVVTNPVTTTSKPIIQIRGFSVEPLAKLSFSVSNVSGTVSQQASITDQYYDTNQLSLTTNWFQCFDVNLAEGTNHVILQATDLAGNVSVTNLACIFSTNGDVTAPVITPAWPQDFMRVSGTNITIRGKLDDETASITALHGTNLISGIVERDGTFWIEGLSLTAGTNAITLQALDAAGNAATNNLHVIRSAVALTITPLVEANLRRLTNTISGTVSDSSYAVWVNGVPAVVNPNGTWDATGVPTGGNQGTSTTSATAYPPGEDPGSSSYGPSGSNASNPQTQNAVNTEMNQEKGPYIFLKQYKLNYACKITGYTILRNTPVIESWETTWNEGSGSHARYDSDMHPVLPPTLIHCYTEKQWPADTWTPGTSGKQYISCSGNPPAETDIGPGSFPMESCNIQDYVLTYNNTDGTLDTATFNRSAQMVVQLFTGGKSVSGRKALFQLSTFLAELEFIWTSGGGTSAPVGAVPAEQTFIGGYGPLDQDYTTYAALSDGQTVDVTPRTGNVPFYSGQPGQAKFRPTISWTSDITDKSVQAVVGQKIALSCALSDSGSPPPVSNYSWSVPGVAVAGYSADKDVATVNTNIIMTNSSVTFYWVSGGTKTVTCTANVRGQSLSASTTFDVFRPTGGIVTYTNSVTVDSNYHLGLSLHFGTASPAEASGILWSNIPPISLPPGVSGRVEWVQIMDLGTNFLWSPYDVLITNRFGYDPPNYPVLESWGGDSPGTKLANFTFIYRNDNFSLWLMFRPSNAGAIPVPLRKLTWGWEVTATNSAGTWTGGGRAWVSPAVDTLVHPTWTKNRASY